MWHMVCILLRHMFTLLMQEYNAKLSDFGLAKDGPVGDKTHVSTRVMGTYGYAAPEYVMTGECIIRLILPVESLFSYNCISACCVHIRQVKICRFAIW